MIEIQILSKILQTGSLSIIINNNLDESYFVKYNEEYKFIVNHQKEYGVIPDKLTFLSKFNEFDIVEVEESDKYLVDTIREEHLYSVAVPIVNKIADLMQNNTNDAIDYLQSQLPKLVISDKKLGVDIIQQANERYEEYVELKNNPTKYFIETGFEELDEALGGWHKGEELVVIVARTGSTKSWQLIKMLSHAWKMGNRVGLLEPEMGASKTGYRFDTLVQHFSNRALVRGKEVNNYKEYINDLKNKEVPFIVTHPKDFERKVTVSKLKSFCISNKLDILAIDGIKYLTDERKERGDSITTQLTNISEDLMDLSIELEIPIIVVVQSNREGAQTSEPELENIRDSDGIAHNASVVLSVGYKTEDKAMTMAIKKSRNSEKVPKLTYTYEIDIGEFTYIPTENNNFNDEEIGQSTRRSFGDKGERF